MRQLKRDSRFRKIARLLLKGILWGGVFGLLLLITLPFWMGIVLKTVIPEDLVTIGDYQTSGYGRFGLSEIEVTSPGIKVQVDRFEAPSLLVIAR